MAKTLEFLLKSQGFSVGLYTSPHLVCTCERIQINSKPISKNLFTYTFEKIKKEANSLTHFETLTLMATHIFFVQKPVDWGIFEVGLGGIKDATNAIPHQTSIITTLGYDHEHILGYSLKKIAKNKLGIVKKNNLVISSKLHKDIKKLKLEVCKKTNCRWKTIDNFDYSTNIKNSKLNTTLKMYNESWKLNLHGKRGAENTALALTTFKNLGFNPAKIKNLEQINWPGRMSKLKVNSLAKIYLSGDHNVQGLESLIEILQLMSYKKIYFVVGLTKKRDPDKMLPLLFNLKNSTIYLTTTKFMGKAKEDYGLWINKSEGFYKLSINALKEAIKRARKDDLIVVTGSLYLIGEIIKKYKA